MSERISFSRAESWVDRLGKHSVTDIRKGKKVIGKIRGESYFHTFIMDYDGEAEGIVPVRAGTLNECKRMVLAAFALAADRSGK